MSTYQEDKQEAANARHRADQAEIFYQWLQKNPQFGYTAAVKMIQDYYHGGDWGADDLSDSAARLVERGVIAPLGAKTDEQIVAEDKLERADLISFIMENRTWASQESKESEFRRLSRVESEIPIVSTETLRTIKSNIEEKRRLSALSKKDLQAEAKVNIEREQAARGVRSDRWLPIPPIYSTRSMMISLANESPADFRILLRKCGEKAVNDVLRQVKK